MKKYSYLSTVNALIISTFMIVACGGESAKTVKNTELKQSFIDEVKTVKATISERCEELTLSGKVEYNPEKIIHYFSLIGGVVEHTYFSLGDKVVKGQIMFDLRSPELSAMQSEYVVCESSLEVARRELQSAEALYEDKILSEKELSEINAKVRQAQAAFEKIKNDLSLYVNKGNGVFAVKASMSGYIVDKKIVSGSSITSGETSLFTIADLSEVWITANVYAGDLLFVKEGMEVKIKTLSYRDEVFGGKIDAVSQVFDPEEKVLKARIVMKNADLKFKPEMTVVVTLENKSEKLIAIPRDALIFDNDSYFAIVEESAAVFVVREVETKGHNGNIAYIFSGINENENIVIKNQLLIYEELSKSK